MPFLFRSTNPFHRSSEMEKETIVDFDETHLRLPSCRQVHSQLRSQFDRLTSDDYVEYFQRKPTMHHFCGIVRQDASDLKVLAVAVYRYFLTTFDTVRFELDDLVVDRDERKRGLGSRLFEHLLRRAKECESTNSEAQRFFFRFGLGILVYEFQLERKDLLTSNDQIDVLEINDDDEQWLLKAHEIHRELRPHLPADPMKYIDEIRTICRAGPATLLVAVDRTRPDEIIGLAVYRKTKNTIYSEYIYCDDLVCTEAKRSSGVGRCLINSMKKQVEHELILDSGCQRSQAHRFYYREGFRIARFGFSKSI